MSKGRSISVWQDFEAELSSRADQIAAMLPPNVRRDRFIASAIAAVKQTPELLQATPRSLFTAITKSAQDGLLPDGREGVITAYNEKQKDKTYLLVASWNPMTFGMRKRARELDSIIVDAQVVYANDHFVWHQGDEAKIEHVPADLGQDRGAKIGAYAIFKASDGTVLHREVMDVTQINAVRSQSKNPDGLLWGKFDTEAWRKTVTRRGFKTVPCSPKLQTIVERDDEAYDFDETGHATKTVVQAIAGKRALPPVVGARNVTEMEEPEPTHDLEAGEIADAAPEPGETAKPDAELAKAEKMLADLADTPGEYVEAFARNAAIQATLRRWKEDRPELFDMVDRALAARLPA